MTDLPTRPVHLGDILTFTTGVMCAPGGEDALLRLTGFMVNRNLFHFQLLRAGPIVTPALHEQFPSLAAITGPNFTGVTRADRGTVTKTWRDELVAEHGAMHRVRRLPDSMWEDLDPVAEWAEVTGGKPLIVQVAKPDGGYETITNPPLGTLRNPPFNPGERAFMYLGR